jgi:anti-sigma regulatory factor (Ser/Thr protein kinase)
LQRWDATERSEDIAIVVSELLTNALRHAVLEAEPPRFACPIRFGLVQPGRCVMCAVADPSPKVPVPQESAALSETGRGLHVVGMLADAWGYTPPSDTGKVVWALFDPDGATAHRPASPRPAMTVPPLTYPRTAGH